MSKRKVRSKRSVSKKSYCLGLDKMIWGLAAFLALAYMVISVAPKVSAK